MFCPQCGFPAGNQNFCPKCGKPLPKQEAPAPVSPVQNGTPAFVNPGSTPLVNPGFIPAMPQKADAARPLSVALIVFLFLEIIFGKIVSFITANASSFYYLFAGEFGYLAAILSGLLNTAISLIPTVPLLIALFSKSKRTPDFALFYLLMNAFDIASGAFGISSFEYYVNFHTVCYILYRLLLFVTAIIPLIFPLRKKDFAKFLPLIFGALSAVLSLLSFNYFTVSSIPSVISRIVSVVVVTLAAILVLQSKNEGEFFVRKYRLFGFTMRSPAFLLLPMLIVFIPNLLYRILFSRLYLSAAGSTVFPILVSLISFALTIYMIVAFFVAAAKSKAPAVNGGYPYAAAPAVPYTVPGAPGYGAFPNGGMQNNGSAYNPAQYAPQNNAPTGPAASDGAQPFVSAAQAQSNTPSFAPDNNSNQP